jgi:hypothetical protein
MEAVRSSCDSRQPAVSQVPAPSAPDLGRPASVEAASNPTCRLPRAGDGPCQRGGCHRGRVSPFGRAGAETSGLYERRPRPACHYRAIHSGPGRSSADSHGQRHSSLDLRHSLSSQVATLPDLALGAGGRRFKSGRPDHQHEPCAARVPTAPHSGGPEHAALGQPLRHTLVFLVDGNLRPDRRERVVSSACAEQAVRPARPSSTGKRRNTVLSR